METPPNLQVYDLGHLGLVARVLDRIRLVETVDRLVGPRPGEKVSTGMALKAAILNALGFVASPLYLFGHFFQGKPTEHLLGPGVTPDLLNDDRMGRMLDTLYAAGVTEVFLEVAREARQAFPFPVQALHVDSTSFHVHGQYEGLGEEMGAIRVTLRLQPGPPTRPQAVGDEPGLRRHRGDSPPLRPRGRKPVGPGGPGASIGPLPPGPGPGGGGGAGRGGVQPGEPPGPGGVLLDRGPPAAGGAGGGGG
jgi:hypothetical protein